MESYRYQIKSKEEYKNFLGFLTEEGYNFSSSFHHEDFCDDRCLVTIYLSDSDTEQEVAAITNYLDKSHTTVEKTDKMMGRYANAQAAVDDLYVDTESLRLFLIDQLEAQYDLNKVSKAEAEKTQKEIERLTAESKSLKDDKHFYMDRYLKMSKENDRIKEQIQAFMLLLNSLFPKED